MATETQLNLKRLSPNELEALYELLARLKTEFGERVVRVALFGSKSRGDDRPDSDMDLLIIVQEENWQLQRALIEVGSEVGMKYDVIFDLRIIGRQR
ncbi:MAG: nucleotidyltransferase domain-containing protein [Anaerolineales bacterium]|nr:nucleotidyltransferase domain-containing protein [Anaerolineales bacterium]